MLPTESETEDEQAREKRLEDERLRLERITHGLQNSIGLHWYAQKLLDNPNSVPGASQELSQSVQGIWQWSKHVQQEAQQSAACIPLNAVSRIDDGKHPHGATAVYLKHVALVNAQVRGAVFGLELFADYLDAELDNDVRTS
ncbi:MAG: hypothetical protein MHM6MM_006237 [Cercozoa sp. M6MM]